MKREQYFKLEVRKIDNYKGVEIFTSNNTPRESVAMMSPLGYIEIHPDAYAALREKPDYLKRIYDHEITEGPGHGEHACKDTDIIAYLKEKGYDFGDFVV